jgi:hypothetical protein
VSVIQLLSVGLRGNAGGDTKAVTDYRGGVVRYGVHVRVVGSGFVL